MSDASNKGFLPGATVTLVETGRTTTADSGGRFSFLELAEGNYSVRVSYIGYENKTTSVSVPASGAVPLAIQMGDETLQLDKLVVEGYREGRARALQQKQSQPNIADLISADSIGNLPDRNAAEAVARVPGVSITGLQQGEGRYISIRGVEPNLNQVLLDGAILAAPGGSRLGRAVPLDTLGAGDISQIEVVKSVTPDLDANSLGGTINIKSASPFDRKGRFIAGSVVGNSNEDTDKQNYEAKVTFSDQFGPDRKWGIAASASYDQRDYSNHWLQTSWNLRNINGSNIYLPNGFEIKPEEGNLKRWGGNLTFEFRPDDSTRFYIRPSYSGTKRFEHTVEVLHSVNNQAAGVTLTSPTTGTFLGSGTRTERRDFRTFTEQELINVVVGGKKTVGAFTFEPMLTYSAAEERTPSNRILAFRNAGGTTADPNRGSGPMTFDIGAFDFVRWEVDPAIDTPSKYTLRRTRDDTGLVDEDTMSAKFDVRWDSENILGRPGYLKTGVKYIQRSRMVDLESYRLVPVGNWSLANIGVLPSVPVYNGRYQSGFLINHFPTWDFINANPSLVVYDPADSIPNQIEDDYDIDEYIYAGYVMGSIDINKLTVLGGLRWEKTDATIRAVQVRNAGTTIIGRFPTSGTTSYDKIFPNLQAVYRFTDRLLMRAAITQTIGRPAYEDARPLARFRYDPLGSGALNPNFPYSGTLSVGNPELEPFDATNIDLSLEYYPRGNGIISVAAFRKDIDNPIYGYSETLENVVYSGIALQSLSVSSTRNATSGKISGVEFNVYQPFTFLPAPFDGFGIDANFTMISSEVKVPLRPNDDLPFFRQPSRIANVTFFYENSKFSGRVAYSYSDEQIETLGSDILSDRYRVPRGQIDVLFRYKINSRYAVTGSVRNLNREPEQRSTGVFNLMQYSRLLGRDYRLGLDFTF
ncbi:MAG: TonB-dependent receptor [Opitutaceae bacterium]|nr:TonB-dependent receptor [Opitutaceae bacterium]